MKSSHLDNHFDVFKRFFKLFRFSNSVHLFRSCHILDRSKTLSRQKTFEKNAQKSSHSKGALKRGTSEIVNIGDPLEKKNKFSKSLTMPKNCKGGPFGIFQHPFCRRTAKKLKGDPLRKNISGKETGKPFLVHIARANVAYWCNTIL